MRERSLEVLVTETWLESHKMPFDIPDIDETQAPLLDHLIELRGRLLRAVMALGAAFAVCMVFADRIFGFLVRPLTAAFPPGQGRLIYTKLYEAFFVNIKVALFAAFFLSFPVIANQMWAFVAPGLYAKEKRAFLPFLIATPILFTSGAALAYYVVMPTAFRWFLGFEGTRGGLKLEALPGTGDYLALVMQFILAFGISFLLPVLLLLLNRAGIVTRQQLSGARRYVIVGITALAAVITPPDVVSQLMLAIPMYLLFEGSLAVMWFGERKAAKLGNEVAGQAIELAADVASNH
ncbi:MAG: twin-arginine translocase subunit TatC [Pseudomonadota bacterium]